MRRRDFVKAGLAAGATVATGASIEARASSFSVRDLKGNINHSVCKWCYGDFTVAELAAAVKEMGIGSIELLDPPDWPVVKEHGLVCAMANNPVPQGFNRIADGFNRIENHEWLVPGLKERIREVAEAGFPNVICFSGNRRGLDDEKGLEICATGIKQIMSTAEQHNVTVCMELLNSKVNHKDYQCDHTVWGVELCKRVGSDRFKLLYDIYHMQIMEGDIIRNIRDYHEYIGHYHTGGNPGRNEIDQSQELNYSAIMQAIADTGYEGFVAQEFIPTRDPLTSLQEAIDICDV